MKKPKVFNIDRIKFVVIYSGADFPLMVQVPFTSKVLFSSLPRRAARWAEKLRRVRLALLPSFWAYRLHCCDTGWNDCVGTAWAWGTKSIRDLEHEVFMASDGPPALGQVSFPRFLKLRRGEP